MHDSLNQKTYVLCIVLRYCEQKACNVRKSGYFHIAQM